MENQRKWTAAQLVADLKQMGDTAEEVSQQLRAHEAIGRRGSCTSCPVAVRLSQLGWRWPLLAYRRGQLRVSVRRPGVSWVTPEITVKPPRSISTFVYEFDARRLGAELELDERAWVGRRIDG